MPAQTAFLISPFHCFPPNQTTASFIGPINVLSFVYFICLLVATPLYAYSRWVPLRVRKHFSLSLIGVSTFFLLFQSAVLIVELVNHSSTDSPSSSTRAFMEAISIHRPISFFLFSFLTRDVAVLLTAILVAKILNTKQRRGLAHLSPKPATPIQLLPKNSFLDHHWRSASLALLVFAGVVYPSLLSMPFYLAYLITFGAWSLDFSGQRNSSSSVISSSSSSSPRSSKSSRLYEIWETGMAVAGAVYVGVYLLLIYLFQMAAVARRVNVSDYRQYGIMNVVLPTPTSAPLRPSQLAVFILHVCALGLLYMLSTSIITTKVLSLAAWTAGGASSSAALQVQPGPNQAGLAHVDGEDDDDFLPPAQCPPISHVSSSSREGDVLLAATGALTAGDVGGGGGGGGAGMPESQRRLVGASSTASYTTGAQDDALFTTGMKSMQFVDENTTGAPDAARTAGAAAASSPGSSSNLQSFAQWLVAKYGLYLCFLVYIILALQRPTVLGFVFMAIVMIGAVLPDFVFRACAPVLLVYTGGYAAAVYWFGSVAIRNSYFAADAEKLLAPIGLVVMDPFSNGWLVAGVPLCMVTLLGFTWRYRESKAASASAAAASLSSTRSLAAVPPKENRPLREWVLYLEDYLVAHNLGLYFCLHLCFAVGVSHIGIWHFPFIFAAAVMVVFPVTAPYLWLLVVGYTQGFVLYQYWRHFHLRTAFGVSDMILPVVFFVFACRQFLVYVHAFRARYFASRDDGNNTSGAITTTRSPPGLRPTSRQIRAVMSVNGALYVTKIVLRLVLMGVMWHLAFHSPLTVFSVGYMVLLAVMPFAFVVSKSYRTTSRQAFPRLFRAMAVYAGIVLCLVHTFCADGLTGVSLDDYIGARLRDGNAPEDKSRATTFMALNWVVQFLAATQTEILRQQDVNLRQQFGRYPLFVHALKQVLPFALAIIIFAFTWEYISLFGALVLYLGILNAVVGRKVTLVWRLMVVFSILVALAIAVFDFGYFEPYSSIPVLYWIGFRRGQYVPNPDASRDSALPDAAKGWVLSPSAEAYLVIAFLAALQFFYTTPGPEDADDEPPARDRRKLLTAATASAPAAPAGAGDLTPTGAVPKADDDDDDEAVIDNAPVLALGVSSIIELLHGPVPTPPAAAPAPASDSAATESADAGAAGASAPSPSVEPEHAPAASGRACSASRFPNELAKRVLINLYRTLHALFLTSLSTCMAFSFEFCVIWTVIAAVSHADLISLLYLGFFIVLVSLPRSVLRYRWKMIVHALAVLVLAEYMFILRLPPDLVLDPRAASAAGEFLGSRQCSIFAQYTDTGAQGAAYTYGQWFGLCITDDVLVVLDFVMLVLAIVQNKRFKADPRKTLRINKPLFARLTLAKPNPEKPPDADATTSGLVLGRFLVLQYAGYVIVLTVVILSTLTFNVTSLGYLLLVALMVQTHAQEGLLTARRFMWTRLAVYAWFCLTLRIMYQIPSWPTSWSTGSGPVLLGLRKVYNSAYSGAEYPPEMVFDAVILILIVIQRRIFLSPDFQRVVDELWYAEQYDYVAHGCHVVNQLEKIREDAMVRIRKQIKTMYEQLDTVARARMEQADNENWEDYLFKNRNAAASSPGREEPRQYGDDDVDGAADNDPDSDEDGNDGDQANQPLLLQSPEAGTNAASSGSASADREPSLAVDEQDSLLFGAQELKRERSDGPTTASSSASSRASRASRASRLSPPPELHLAATLPRRPGAIANVGLSLTDNGLERQFTSGEGGGGGRTTRTGTRMDPSLSLVTPVAYRPSLGSVMGAKPEDQDSGSGGRGQRARSTVPEPTKISTWLEAVNQTNFLRMKDPLEITEEDLEDAVAANEAMTRARTPTMLLDAPTAEQRMSPAPGGGQRRMTALFTPVLVDMGEEQDSDIIISQPQRTAQQSSASPLTGGSSALSLSSLASSTAPQAAPPSPPPLSMSTQTSDNGASSPPRRGSVTAATGNRLERLVMRSFEELKREEIKRDNNKTKDGVSSTLGLGVRLQKVGLQLLRNIVRFFNSRSTSLVYFVLVIAHMYEPSLLNLIYPLSVFGYALLQNPRSLPRIGGSLIHPMIQNPPRHFWHFLLAYSFAVLVMKFVYQFPFFCMCGNNYSHGRQCPSALVAFQDVCEARSYPHLDYFVDQPIVRDYFLGIFKAYKSLRWNWLSVRYEPVDHLVPAEPPGVTSGAMLDSGLGGAFLVSFLGDFLVLLAVLWHTHVLKIRGVWLSRDPEFLSQDGEGKVASPSPLEREEEGAGREGGKEAGAEVAEEEEEQAAADGAGAPAAAAATPASPAAPLTRQPSLFSRVCWPFSQARTKPGCDLYVSLFFIQCTLFLFVLLAYQHADQLFQSVRENQLSGGFILVLLLHFVLIVADRCLYLHRSIKGKFILQMMLLFCIYVILHSNFTFRIGINQHGPVFVWYLFMCLYLFVSALQISYGYPPFIQTNWMTKRAHHFWGNIFRLYRALPFLYELRMLLDWTCTPTTLYLGEWIKLEDIYAGIFVIECNLDFQRLENRKKGDKQPARRKWLCGFLFFALLNLLIWLPLFVFSTGSLSQFENYVKMGSLSVQLNGFPMLYEAASADYISPLLPPETWSSLAQVNPALALLPATSTNDYMRELQFVRLPRSSQELWKISPPAEADLLTVLEGRANMSDSVSAMNNQAEMTLQFAFGTQDGSVNQGKLVHPLAREEKQQLAEIIRGTRTSLRLQAVLPSVIRISTTKEVTPLVATGDILADCMLAFTMLGDEVSSAGDGTDPTSMLGGGGAPPGGTGNTNFTTAVAGWWDLTCGNAAAGGCANPLEPRGQDAATVPLNPETGEPEPGCNPSVYTISSEKTIGSYFAITYGIIGLYFTVVFTIGRFVHMSVMYVLALGGVVGRKGGREGF